MAPSTDDPSDRVPGAVLFEIDGTLVDSAYLHVNAWVQAPALRDAGAIAVYDDVAALLADLDLSPLAMTWNGTVVR